MDTAELKRRREDAGFTTIEFAYQLDIPVEQLEALENDPGQQLDSALAARAEEALRIAGESR